MMNQSLKAVKPVAMILLSICFLAALTGCCISHEWTQATCTAPKTCSKCGKTEGEPLGHTWVAATCTEPKTCSVCGTVEVEPLGHKWKDATCFDPKTCTVCGETEGDPLQHNVTEWTVITEPTCTEKGTESGTCTVCGETVVQAIACVDHTPGDWEITKEPTEFSKGTRVKKCTVCGKEVETESFEMTAEEIEQNYKSECKSISYKDLERTPDDYKGQKVRFSGRVLQVCSEASSSLYYSAYRVATSGRYDNVVFLRVDTYGSGSRILEDDYITFYGTYDGLYTYEAVRGNAITIPQITAKYMG